MAGTVKAAILRGRKTVETVVEESRKKAEKVVEEGLNTVDTVVDVSFNTVETVVVEGRKKVESAVSLGRKTVEHALLHGRSTMQAAVLHGREDIRIEHVPIPEAAPGELIVRVGAALTCGTDLKVFRRGYHARMIVPPALFGHELAGTVVEAGEGVAGFVAWRPRGGAQLRAMRRVLFLRARPGESLRRSALQQRRLRGVHPHSGAHCGQKHASCS